MPSSGPVGPLELQRPPFDASGQDLSIGCQFKANRSPKINESIINRSSLPVTGTEYGPGCPFELLRTPNGCLVTKAVDLY